MSLARAFTTRRAKVFGGDGEGKPSRSLTVNKGANGGTVRSKISAPLQLVSTTNMLSYNAPDIVRTGSFGKISAPVQLVYTTNALSYDAPDIQLKEPRTAASDSSMSLHFERDDDLTHTAASSPPTSPDTASPRDAHDDSAKSATGQPNHLSNYFTLPETATLCASEEPPLLKRAPSHTKRQLEPLNPPKASMSDQFDRKTSLSEQFGRKPSMSTMSQQSSGLHSTKTSAPFSPSSSASTNTAASSQKVAGGHQGPKTFQAPPTASAALFLSHNNTSTSDAEPFGQELAQVTELAEEYAVSAAKQTKHIATLEDEEIAERGLQKFSPEEYVAEISSLISTFFGDVRHAKNHVSQWI